MTAIPHAALALTSALDRFDTASQQLIGAVTGAGGDPGEAIAEMTMAKTQIRSCVAVLRFSDEMWSALVEIGQERR
ncbi:MAG: hypothetical protein AB7O98_10070 [Hyphomonadaceae bacterium]